MIAMIKSELEPPKSLDIPDLATGAPTVTKGNILELYNHPNEPTRGSAIKIGVPMGLALAPLMAVLVLQYAMEKSNMLKDSGAKILTYADDGLIG